MARVEAYWDVCVSVAEYYDCLRQLDEFRRLRQAAPRLNSVPDEIGATLSARRDAAERTALAAQHRLASMIGREAERLPLPMEAPHCGSYHTRYEQVFAGRPSPEADKLSRLIPMLHMQLQETCADVMRSEAWLSSLAAATKPAADGLTGELAGDAAFLPSWELHSLRRRAFLHYVRDYNRRIARYVELAAPGPIDSEQLIGMLVKRDVPAMATRPSGSPPRERQSSSDTRPPQTYARGAGEWVPAGWSESASAQGGGPVTPASGQGAPLSPNERSLLVPRR
jgi:hypothetical protein